jgi:hypothetical protein
MPDPAPQEPSTLADARGVFIAAGITLDPFVPQDPPDDEDWQPVLTRI